MNVSESPHGGQTGDFDDEEFDDSSGMTFFDMLSALRTNLGLLILGPIIAGALAFGVAMLIPPTFTASTTLLPPQQSQGGAAAALASLGPLAGLATGGVGGVSSAGDRYLALMNSVTLTDRIIEQFKLMQVYGTEFRIDARKILAGNVRISLGKKDGLISVEVDDHSPQRAADIANRYVDELRRITSTLAVTEAQQRRVFFERQLQQSRDRLIVAQQALQSSGFNPGALKAEPKSAADAYARLKAEATSAEVRLQILRSTMADGTSEIRQQQTTLAALREQLAQVEQASDKSGGPDYVGKYREFKYQETLFELYARQFELARVDESREGDLIQVIDIATSPEKKSKPRRAVFAGGAALVTVLLLASWVLLRQSLRLRAARAEP